MTVYGIQGSYDNGLYYEDSIHGSIVGEILYMNKIDALSVLKSKKELTKLFCITSLTTDYEFHNEERPIAKFVAKITEPVTGYVYEEFDWYFCIKEFELKESAV